MSVLEGESNGVVFDPMPKEINVKDEAECQLHYMRTQSKARTGEFVFKRIV